MNTNALNRLVARREAVSRGIALRERAAILAYDPLTEGSGLLFHNWHVCRGKEDAVALRDEFYARHQRAMERFDRLYHRWVERNRSL